MKLRTLVVSLLMVAASICVSSQTYSRMDFSLQTAQGQAVAGATVNVYTQTAWGVQGTTPATLYLTANGTVLTSPPVTDGTGHAYAYAAFPANGYTVQYSSPYTNTTTYLDQVTESYYPSVTVTPYAVAVGGATAGSPLTSVPIGAAGLPLLSGGPSAYPGFGVLGIPGGGSGANTSQGAATNIVDGNEVKPSSIATNQQILNPPASGPSTALIQSALVGTANDIYLAPGVYTTDRLSLNRSNVTIHGAGEGITILQSVCPLALTPQYGSSGGLFYVWPTSGSLSNVSVKDLTMIGCDSTVPVTSVTFDGTNAIITANQHLTAGQNVSFNGLVGGKTPSMNGGGDWTVLSTGLSSTQFEVTFGVPADGPFAQTTANYWLWNGSIVNYPLRQGVIIDGCNNCSVVNVDVENMGGESILFAPSLVGDNALAQNDYVLGGAGNSISSNFSYGAHFIDNTIQNTFGGNCLGWSGDATVAQGNVIRNCSGYGIGAGGSGYVHDVLGYDAEISGNVIDGAHNCIQLSDDGATSTVSRWYDIANNTCTNYNFFGFESDLTQAGDVVFIKGLNVTGGGQNASYGGTIAMAFENGSGTYYISNSTIVGSGSPTDGQIYGIAVISGSPVIIPSNNTINNNEQGDIVTLGGTPTFNNGINLLTGGSEVPSLKVTGLTPHKCVDTGDNGLLESTADDCGASGGGGNIPSNAIFAFVPNSASDDDNHVLSPAVALTSWSTTGSTTTVINTGTNGFSANQWVSMRFATSFPASPHGFTWYKVLSAGLSSTQFELDTTGVSPGTCSSTCGSAYNAMPYLPFATTGSPGMPTAAINNTYGSCGGTDPSSNACTLYGMETNYSTILHPISPAVTGVPGYLIVVGPNNDIGLNYTLANIETYYQTLFSEAHTDGWVIAVLSPTGANFNQYFAENAFANQVAIDTWLRGQGKTTVQATTPGSSQYWDIWSDVGSVDWDGGDTSIIAANTGYGPTGAKSAAVTLSSDIQTANGTVKPRRQLWWAGPVSGGSTGNNGYVFIPGTEPVATWRWMSADLTTSYAQLNHNTFSALEVYAGSISSSGCPGGRPLCTSGGFNIDLSNNLWAVNGINAGSGGSNLVCWNTNGGTTACGSSGLSGMTTGQVGVAGSSSTITSSKPIAGTGSGLASGPTSATVAGDVVTYADTAGTQQDSSTLLSSLAPKASPTFTGTPAAPTATGGTNTTQIATTAFVQAAIAAAGTGAGIVTYSGPALTFTGTLYFPIGGGGLSSATETNVDIDSPAAVTIQNMTVQLSTAPGVGNSIAFTWRKNASSQTLTCTISGASATSCSDTTHNFTTASLDLLDIQVVTTGSVVGTPTVVMAAQVGVAAPATGVTSVFGQTGAVPNLSGDVTTAGSSVATVEGINGVPLCTGFTPTTGQNLQYTTASSPNPCYTAASGGGATVTAAPPYVEIGSTFYDHDFYAVTKPPVCASTTWLNSVTPSSCTNGTNGDVVIKTSSANQYWATQTATSSVEGVFSISSNTTATSNVSGGGIWIYDSTNSKVYLLQAVGTGNAEYILGLNSYNCTSPCSSTSPSGASGLFTWWGSGAYGVGGNAHLKLSVSGSTLTIAISLNGGVTFMTLATESVGTITKGGYAVNVSSTDTTMMDVQSILVQ